LSNYKYINSTLKQPTFQCRVSWPGCTDWK